MSFFSDREWRTARTVHVCWVCARKIEQRERYEYQTSYQDGWVTFRTCEHCAATVRTAFNMRLLDDEWDTDVLYEVLSEWTISTARLAVGIRRKWLAFCGYKLLPVPDVIPRTCCERGCTEPVNQRSHTWCAAHDAERIERIGRQLADIAASFGGRS